MASYKKPDPGLPGLLAYLRKLQGQKERIIFATEENADRAGRPGVSLAYRQRRLLALRGEAAKLRGWADRLQALLETQAPEPKEPE